MKPGAFGQALSARNGAPREDLGIVGREVEADVERLLVVGAGGRIERLVQQPGIAAVAADLLDRDLRLLGDRQREERPGLREGLVHQRSRDAVVDDVEEADGAAGARDLVRRPLEAVLGESLEVDDRQAFQATPPWVRR